MQRTSGQYHPKAVLTDDEVEQVRRLREEEGWSYGQLMKKFELPKSTVQYLCNYRRR